MHSQTLRNGETDREHLIEIIEEFHLEDTDPKLSEKISNLIRNTPHNLNKIETNILIMDLFYKHFNIYNGTNEEKLIGPVLFLEKEKVIRPKRLNDLIIAYSKNKIKNIFGFTLTEFINLPYEEIYLLLESAEDINEMQHQALDEYIEETKELTGG